MMLQVLQPIQACRVWDKCATNTTHIVGMPCQCNITHTPSITTTNDANPRRRSVEITEHRVYNNMHHSLYRVKSSPQTDPCMVLRSMRDVAALNERHNTHQHHPNINLWSTYSDISKGFTRSQSPSSPFYMPAAMIPRKHEIFGKPYAIWLNLIYHQISFHQTLVTSKA